MEIGELRDETTTIRMGNSNSIEVEAKNGYGFVVEGGIVTLKITNEVYSGLINTKTKSIVIKIDNPDRYIAGVPEDKAEGETQSNYIGRLLAGLEEEIKERTKAAMDELARDLDVDLRIKKQIEDPEHYDIWGKRPESLREAWVTLMCNLLEISKNDGYRDDFKHFAYGIYHRMISLEYDALMRKEENKESKEAYDERVSAALEKLQNEIEVCNLESVKEHFPCSVNFKTFLEDVAATLKGEEEK